MDLLERIDTELEQGFDQLNKLEVGSEDYKEVLKSIQELELLRSNRLDSDSNRKVSEHKVRIEEIRANTQKVEEENKELNEKGERKIRIIEKVLTIVGGGILTIMVCNAEQTSVLSLKPFEVLSKLKLWR